MLAAAKEMETQQRMHFRASVALWRQPSRTPSGRGRVKRLLQPSSWSRLPSGLVKSPLRLALDAAPEAAMTFFLESTFFDP